MHDEIPFIHEIRVLGENNSQKNSQENYHIYLREVLAISREKFVFLRERFELYRKGLRLFAKVMR